jgi:hypothetical protein
MQVTIEKKHVYFLSVCLLILAGAIFTTAQNLSTIRIHSVGVNPFKVKNGDTLTVYVVASSDVPIITATAEISHDQGIDTVTLKRVAEDSLRTTLATTWKVHDVHDPQEYPVRITVADQKGNTATTEISYFDPIPNPGHGGADIEASGLTGTATNLNIGGNAATATTATTAGNSNACSNDGTCETGNINPGGANYIQFTNAGAIGPEGHGGSRNGGLYAVVSGNGFIIEANNGDAVILRRTIGCAGATVSRCTSDGGTLPSGALTTDSSKCATSSATGLALC